MIKNTIRVANIFSIVILTTACSSTNAVNDIKLISSKTPNIKTNDYSFLAETMVKQNNPILASRNYAYTGKLSTKEIECLDNIDFSHATEYIKRIMQNTLTQAEYIEINNLFNSPILRQTEKYNQEQVAIEMGAMINNPISEPNAKTLNSVMQKIDSLEPKYARKMYRINKVWENSQIYKGLNEYTLDEAQKCVE